MSRADESSSEAKWKSRHSCIEISQVCESLRGHAHVSSTKWIGRLFNLQHLLIMFEKLFVETYRKVASSRLSRLIAHPRIFRLFMKGNFDAYVMWPLDKMVQNWVVDRSTAREFTVCFYFKIRFDLGEQSCNSRSFEGEGFAFIHPAKSVWPKFMR